jgi:large subunit ribosomal protein L21e
MPHSYGYRGRTRHLFKRDFRKSGGLSSGQNMASYATIFKVGDIVDIKGNSAIQKSLPHKYYHGKTGIIWNVTPRAVGVEVEKVVGNRKMRKRIHVRVQHVSHSKCRTDFLNRVDRNREALAKAKKEGKKVSVKRIPAQPIPAAHVRGGEEETLFALPYAGIPV